GHIVSDDNGNKFVIAYYKRKVIYVGVHIVRPLITIKCSRVALCSVVTYARVERETEVTTDMMPPTNNGSTKDVQPLVVQIETPISNSEPVVAPVAELVVAPVSALKPNQKPSTPYLSRLYDQKLHDKTNDQKERIFKIFQDLNFNISFADALILMPKFGPSIKSLLTNKDKLFELAKTPLNEHFPAVLFKKLPEKLGDPGNFSGVITSGNPTPYYDSIVSNSSPTLTPFGDSDFLLVEVDDFLALEDDSNSPEVDHSYYDLFLKHFLMMIHHYSIPVKEWDPGKFLIPCDSPGMDECLALADLGTRINLMPLSAWNKLSLPELTPTLMTLKLADRSISRPIGVAEDVYVKIERALIDVFEGELTLRVGREAITFNLDQTSRYSANYNDMTANRIDVIDIACEEYSQDVLGFFDVIASGNLTPYYDPIVSTSCPTLTPFGDSDFLLEEFDAFLALKDDATSPEVYHSYYDPARDILLLKAFLNDDPSLPPPNQGMYLPQVELQDLPPHLEYAFLEGNDKLPVIIAKDLSDEEKTALIKVLKSHKRAIA
nr:reverse transcriptase domain-containing protein [Tanacetum cinerariifolium]